MQFVGDDHLLLFVAERIEMRRQQQARAAHADQHRRNRSAGAHDSQAALGDLAQLCISEGGVALQRLRRQALGGSQQPTPQAARTQLLGDSPRQARSVNEQPKLGQQRNDLRCARHGGQRRGVGAVAAVAAPAAEVCDGAEAGSGAGGRGWRGGRCGE
jgi:hypothetical protein